jgi:hypothetical protein
MTCGDIHINLFRDLLNYAVYEDYSIVVDGEIFYWDRFNSNDILSNGDENIYLGDISSIKKSLDGRAIHFKENDVERLLILKENKCISSVLNDIMTTHWD